MSSPAIGITGDVTLPTGFSLGVKGGTLTLSLVTIDVTTTSDGGNQKVVGGVRKARGTAIGIPKSGAAGNAPGFAAWASTSAATASGAGVFKVVGTTCQYTFNMLITNIRIQFTYAGSAVLTFDYESDGAIVETWG